MRLLKIIFNFLLLPAVFAAMIFFAFKRLPNTFFQQDEWGTFGNYIYRESYGSIIKAFLESLIAAGRVHVNPASEWLWYLQYKLFGLNFPPYAYVSLLIHLFNTLLVYRLSSTLTKNNYLSLLIATLFAINSISHQAVSWVSTDIHTQGAILISLISAILFLKYLRQKVNNQKFLYLSIALVFAALLFKESSLPFFLLPALIVFYSKEKSLAFFKKVLIPLILATSIYLFFRVVILIIAPPIIVGEVLTQPNPIVHLYRLITFPFKVLPESIIPTNLLLKFSRLIMKLAYPQFIAPDGTPNPFIAEAVGLDLINYGLSAVILMGFFWCFRSFKNKKKDELAYSLAVSLAIIIGSAILTIFIPGRAGFVSIIEPRHLYGSVIGSSLFLVLGFYALFIFLSKETNKALLLTTFFLLSIIYGHLRLIEHDLVILEERSRIRKYLLTTVKKYYPTLPQKTIFYVESDQVYYGQPAEETNLPVQVGFGRMLMVWYQDKEKFPGCFYKDVFFYDLINQGYRYCSGRGFGFFRNKEKMIAALQQNNLNEENIIAFDWKGKEEKFTDITSRVRQEVHFLLTSSRPSKTR